MSAVAYQDPWLTVHQGDARLVLASLPADSIDCVVTSPPYWQQRSYLADELPEKAQEIGLEATFGEWLTTMVDICGQLRRVLRPDGSLWLNIGDRYVVHGGKVAGGGRRGSAPGLVVQRPLASGYPAGLRPKSLVLAPYRFAIAMEEAGWILRDRIVWWKTNGPGESVHDRFHVRDEVLFRFTPGRFAHFDEAAIRVPLAPASLARRQPGRAPTHAGPKAAARGRTAREWYSPGENADTANPGNVWRMATSGGSGRRYGHVATFPPELVRRPILATCPRGGVVLDPFAGSGTTGEVANALMRRAVLIELDPASIESIKVRCSKRSIAEVPA